MSHSDFLINQRTLAVMTCDACCFGWLSSLDIHQDLPSRCSPCGQPAAGYLRFAPVPCLSLYHFFAFRPRRPRHDDDWTHNTYCSWMLKLSALCATSYCQVLSSPSDLLCESNRSVSWKFAFRGSLDVVHFRFGLLFRTWVTPHKTFPSCSYRFFSIE